MRRDLVIAPTPTSAKQCVPAEDQRQFHREAQSRIRARTIPTSDSANSGETVGADSFPGRNVVPAVSHAHVHSSGSSSAFARVANRSTSALIANHGENRRARAGHQRGADFRLLEQPHFQFAREKQIFRKQGAPDRSRNFVAVELLGAVRNSGNFARVPPTRVCPRRWHAELRLQQQDR